jgi:hypothetical protein
MNTTEEQNSLVRFLFAKRLNAKVIHKEMFPVYVGKCLPCKAVHNWVEKLSQGRLKVTDDAQPVAEVAETTVEGLLCCGFRRSGKAMGHVYQCCWRIRREINIFPGSDSTRFPFYTYFCDLFTDSPSHV